MKTRIVLLSGKQGSGKTSIQKELERLWDLGEGHEAVRINFADPIYTMHNAVLEVLHEYMPDRGLVKDGPLLQMLGTEWGRKTLGENVWVECAKANMEHITKLREKYNDSAASPALRDLSHLLGADDLLFIVGDCRFENEFNAFPNALKVRLDASESVRKERCSMWRTNTGHASETDLDRYHRENRFDMYLDTGKLGIEDCANLILNRLCADAMNEPRL